MAVGRAASRLARGGRVLVGRDTRPSSAWLAGCVAGGAAAQGSDVGDAGVVSTPMLGVALADGLGAAGVMVTASHNPWPENGFKVFGAGGAKPDDDLAREIEGWIAADPVEGTPGALGAVDAVGAWELRMELEATGLTGRRVAIDLAHGGATAALAWLRRLPVQWEIIGDGSGLTNDGVGSEHPGALMAAVVERGCAAGIALDGDGDRCVLVDERGHRVDGDALTWLLARDREVRGLAVTVMSNAALEPALPGVRVVRTAVGDRHLKEAMVRNGLALGAEESGHVLFADFPSGDGLLAGLRGLTAALRVSERVSDAFAPFVPVPRRLTKVRVSRRPPLSELPRFSAADRDAVARLGGGRTLVRYSGTEPYLRILVEGPEASTVDAVSAELTAIAREELA